jgi:MFS transporter, DHA1 family, multidrug resistance protein
MMPIWQRNLIVCWLGMFVTGVGFSQIAPILPLYIRHLGVEDTSLIEEFSGIAFGVTFVASAIFSPIWGRLADRIGRKPMLLRASLGMAVVVFVTGFSQNVWELVGLRLLLGVITGYSVACTTLIATQTDKEHAGSALGTLATAGIAGSLLGPLVGGFIGETLGFQNVFFFTGCAMLVVFVLTALFVKESFVRQDKKTLATREAWAAVPEKAMTLVLFLVFFIVYLAASSIEPILTVYITELTPDTSHVALLAGLVFSASGLATIIASPLLGRLSDKVGPHKVLLAGLLIAGILCLPQAFVRDPWQLMAMRFLLGLVTGGLAPSLNSIVKRITPGSITGRVYGFTMSAGYLGFFGGAFGGGQVASHGGIRAVFFFTSGGLLLAAVLVYFRVFKELGHKESPQS